MSQRTAPRVSFDYAFLGGGSDDASKGTVLVVLDEMTGEKYARLVPCKGVCDSGATDWVIQDVSRELQAWGYTGGDAQQLVLKSDGERSVVSLKEAVGRFHGGRAVPEQSARGESESNGAVERAARTVVELTRVLKEQVEGETGQELDAEAPILQWAVRWAAMLAGRYLKGSDGKTPYERRTGRPCGMAAIPFGETVWYRQVREGKERPSKLQSEEFLGVYLGHARMANEHLLGTEEGVIRARTIRRRPPG